ncbi:hypothetical protein TRAPUB_14117 [Trametes pubescens]|uniref:Uncharacterized protein n=1 Tax=Trametes pubescens TaxID=154538 RepID=A0A1M2VP80_TRAPU|nr:hypothetical protein TRAPUB_14117 [Trametes pubescens]
MDINGDTVSLDDLYALDGDHIEFEVSFVYRGLASGKSAESKACSIQYVVPVWVEITGVVGTARARLQLIPDPLIFATGIVKTDTTGSSLERPYNHTPGYEQSAVLLVNVNMVKLREKLSFQL